MRGLGLGSRRGWGFSRLRLACLERVVRVRSVAGTNHDGEMGLITRQPAGANPLRPK
jgi:hypothetical protein